MKILVTGGSGFIGGYVVTELISAGHDVRVFDTRSPSDPAVPYVSGDLTALDDINAAIDGVDAVCHIAAIGDVYLAFERPHLAAAVNVVGTANVLEAAATLRVRRVVYASTWEVYGHPDYEPVDERHPCRPDHPYNITKYAGDLLCQSYGELRGLDCCALRLGTAYGIGMRDTAVLPAFVRKAVAGQPISIQGTGEQFRQFTHARDIATGFRLALERESVPPVLNLVSHERTTIRELAQLVAGEMPADLVPAPGRVGDVAASVITSAAAEKWLGWRARITIREGAPEVIQHFRHALTTAAG